MRGRPGARRGLKVKINKKVTVRNETYKMYQVGSTGWVFARSEKARNTFSIAKIVDNKIIEIDNAPAIRGVTNEELAEAWVATE